MPQLSRYSFLDLYRGIVVVLMLEGHLVREVLGAGWHDTPGFRFHEMIHGLTAPGFLFGAGFTFAIASQKKGDLLRGLNRHVVRRLWRGIMLILIGYALHIPYLSLTKTLSHATLLQWREFLQFDVLQVIGLGLFTLRILYLIIREERWFLSIIAATAFAVVFVTPMAWEVSARGDTPLWLATAISGAFGSPFPVFPSIAFLFAGVVASWGFLSAARAEQERAYMLRLMTGGVFMLGGGALLDVVPFSLPGHMDFWSTSPGFFWIRLGVLFVALGALWFLENSVLETSHARVWMPSWLTTMGMESFFVYILHLLMLYGWVTNPDENITGWLGHDLGPLQAGLWSLPFIGILAIAARWWHDVKHRHAPIVRMGYWWMGLTVAGEFLRRAW